MSACSGLGSCGIVAEARLVVLLDLRAHDIFAVDRGHHVGRGGTMAAG